MNRPLAFFFAMILAFISVSSACMAQSPDMVGFTLEPQRGDPAKIKARFSREKNGRDENNWSTGFMPSDLIGLEVSSFRNAGSRPLHFSIVREAGRLDCSGSGGESYAHGNCRFTSDPAFLQLLAARGIGQPSHDQAFALVAVNAKREMIQALGTAR